MRQTITHNHSFKPFFFFLFSMLLLLPTGCTNDDYNVLPDTDNDEYVPVQISFGGIQTLFGPYGEEARNVQYNKVHETQDFDRKQMLETLVMAEPDTLRPPLTRNQVTNTSVRLVAYDQNNAIYKGTGVYDIDASGNATARSGETLMLAPGKYYFHCFSPAQAISVNGNTVSVNLPVAGGTTDPAFYYAKTTSAQHLTPDATGTKKIEIPPLEPKYCKLVLSVSHSKGTATTYSNAVLTTTLYKGATLALPEGTVTSTTKVTTTTVSSSNSTIYVYPGSTGSFKMTINNVSIGGAPKVTINTETNTSGMTMNAGNAYKVSVSIQVKNYIQLAGTPMKVAKGNILYNSTTGKWYLGPNQGYYCPKQNGGFETLSTNDSDYGNAGDKVFSYINWGVQAKQPNFEGTYSGPFADAYGGNTLGTHYGDKFGYNSTESSPSLDQETIKTLNDPCYAALGGTWHLPTGGSTSADIAYFSKATRSSSYKTYTTKSSLSDNTPRTVSGHYLGTTSQPTQANQDNYVFLPASGYRNNDSEGIINSEGNFGDYWSSTPDGNYTYYLNFGTNYMGDGTGNCDRDYGYPLRCIKY